MQSGSSPRSQAWSVVSEDTTGIDRVVEVLAVLVPNLGGWKDGPDDDETEGNLIDSWTSQFVRFALTARRPR